MQLLSQQPRIRFRTEHTALHVEIETDRLLIRSYEARDFPHCLALYTDKANTRYFDHCRPRTKAEVAELILEKAGRCFGQGKPFGLFSIFYKESMTFLGQIDLLPAAEIGAAEIGFILHPDYQKQGFCTEAVKALLFEYIETINTNGPPCRELPIQKIIATAHPLNHASQRILEKMGMTLDRAEERFGSPRLWYSLRAILAVNSSS